MMTKTVGLQINGKKIYAEEDATILEAARQNGITIPTLCYHPRLQPVGHCRLCIVEVEGIDRPVTSCDNPVQEGMIVATDTAELAAMRSAILELALATHPYKDCLTCVRTGTCELQNNAYVFQANLPEQLERDVPTGDEDADDNPYLVRDEEKCILCGRCIQVCRTGPGRFVYEMIGSGVNTRVVPYRNGRVVSLEEAGCIFCGQCVDVCPVAALTEKGRSRGGREWDLAAVEGVCIECSLGCYLERQVYNGEVIKVTVPAEGDKVSWLCLKGKYGHHRENGHTRLTKALRLNRESGKYGEITSEDALKEAAGKFIELKNNHGPDSLAVLASGQLSIEENYLLQKLAREVLGTVNVDLGAEQAWVKAFSEMKDLTGSGSLGPTPLELSKADTVVIIGSGLEESHPVADMAIARAGRFGDAVLIRTSPGIEDPSAWSGINIGIADNKESLFIEALLAMLRGGNSADIAAQTGIDRESLEKAVRLLTEPNSYLVVAPTFFKAASQQAVDDMLALAMESGIVEKGRSRLLLLSTYSNAGGVLAAGGTPVSGPGFTSLKSENGLSREEVLAAAEKGALKGILSFGPLPADLNKKKLEVLVVIGATEEDANGVDFLLPAQDIETKEGLFVNARGTACLNQAALQPGAGIPEDWSMICDLARRMGAKWNYTSLEDVRKEMEG